jgi:hypothetical protein
MVDAPDELLGNEDSRNPNDEDTDVQPLEKSPGCYPASHHGSEMNPQAEDETNGRNADEEPKERSHPIWNGVRRRRKLRNRGGRTISLQNYDVRFEQYRLGRVGQVAVTATDLPFRSRTNSSASNSVGNSRL